MGQSVTCIGALHPKPMFINCQRLSIQISSLIEARIACLLPVRKNPQLFYNAFDSHARDMYHNSHSEGTCVLLEIPSMHKLVQYFQTVLYIGMRIYMNLKVYILPAMKLIFS